MEKPMTIIIEEAKQKIADCINGLNLSPTLLDFIVKDIYTEIQQAHQNEYFTALKKYDEYLGQEKEKIEDKHVGVTDI